MGRLRAIAVGILALQLAAESRAGAYIFAGEGNGLDVVTHPTGYGGAGGNVDVEVCIVPGSANAAAMEISVRNAIDRFNLLVPTLGNVRLGSDSELASNQVDFESVLTHELGHCIGLAHPNLASESGLSGSARDYTKATDGANDSFDIAVGGDGIIGSGDDVRGDDGNLHWYFVGVNNPFVLPTVPQAGTYTRDLAGLPGGQSFATNADRNVSTSVFGLPPTEAVMQQGSFFDEDQRALTADDVATLLHARTGLDRTAGTADDYTVTMRYGGISSSGSCDVNVAFDDSRTGFAVCQTSGFFIAPSHVAISAAETLYNDGAANWFFGDRRIPLPAADAVTVRTGGTATTLNGGGSSLLANDADQDGAGLVMSPDAGVGPDHGSVTLNADGTFSYSHDGGGSRDDRFVYRVCVDDGSGGETSACAHQVVIVTVSGGGNAAPNAADDAARVLRGGTVTVLDSGQGSVVANDSDPDLDGLTVDTVPVSGPEHGNLALDADGTFSYTHDGSLTGSDRFVYRVCDDGLPGRCATATVDIAVDLGDVVCREGDVVIPDGEPTPATDTAGVASGETLSDLDVALRIDHTYIGDLTVTLTHDATGTAVTLLDRPGLPNVQASFGCAGDDVDVTLSDEAGTPAEDQCDAAPPAMAGALVPAGALADFDGESFGGDWTLTISDGATPDAGTLRQWCLIPTLGAPPNDAPQANADVASTAEGSAVLIDVLANDGDADGALDPASVAVRTPPTNGSTSVNAGTGAITYRPDPDFVGGDFFTYTVSDLDGAASAATRVDITVGLKSVAACGPGGRRVRVGLPASIDAGTEFAGGPFTFSQQGLPPSLAIDPTTGEIAGTPEPEDATGIRYLVTVAARNGGAMHTLTFLLTVEDDSDVAFFSDFESDCIGF